MSSIKLSSCLILLCLAFMGAHTVHAITCGQVQGNLAQCVNYLKSGGAVPPACCNGVKGIVNAARTTADRRNVCNCLKSAAASVPGLVPVNAETLPGKCGVNIPYKISISTNCNSIK